MKKFTLLLITMLISSGYYLWAQEKPLGLMLQKICWIK